MEQARRIAAARKAKNLTQKQVADKLHVSVQAVSQWETGKSSPKSFRMLAIILGVSVDWLLGGEAPIEDTYKPIEAEGNFPIPLLHPDGMFIYSVVTRSSLFDLDNDLRDAALQGSKIIYTNVKPSGMYYSICADWTDDSMKISEGDILIFDSGFDYQDGDRVHYMQTSKSVKVTNSRVFPSQSAGLYSQSIDYYDQTTFRWSQQGGQSKEGPPVLPIDARTVLGTLVEQRSFAAARMGGTTKSRKY